MVDVLMLGSLQDNPADLLSISREYRVTKPSGLEQSFFSGRTIYEAHAYSQVDASGVETDLLGHVIVDSNGELGFDPSVILSGDVDGQSIREFLQDEIAKQHRGRAIWSRLLGGGDVVFGNGFMPHLQGFDGDDVILNEAPHNGSVRASVSGGKGDDLLFTDNTDRLVGGEGADTFVANSHARFYLRDFTPGEDRLLFDTKTFPELGSQITQDNLCYGPNALDADDRIVIAPASRKYEMFIYIDADGSGPEQKVLAGVVRAHETLTANDFGVVDAETLIPDILGDAGKPRVVPLAHGALHLSFEHADVWPAHHGVVQLA